ncbi:MAG: acyl-CoA dehydrogenase family protein [Chloroflexi bacterium]|nr:acyl-CoA dehydrogenase family protein [Chloroflexota bacterium]
MDFGWTDEELAFRDEVRAFMSAHWDADPSAADAEGADTHRKVVELNLAAGEQGWITMAWPSEYGGRDASHVEQLIFNEETAIHGVPLATIGSLIGPTLMVHGTEEQRREHLPHIASGERIWAQGFSEPGAGSDLASLVTRAERDGDHFVVNGQKIWTSRAHRADWIFLLTRTDPEAPKHRGITFLIADMRTPGINPQQIVQMHGDAEFNETFFEDVRIPAENVVGEVNRGWYVATTTLDFERSGVHVVRSARRQLDRLLDALDAGEVVTSQDRATLRRVLADTAIETEVGTWLAYRVAWMQSQGLVPNYEASMSKVLGSEAAQHNAQSGINVLGLYGALKPESPYAPLHGVYCQLYMWTVSRTIAGGTSEVQRNIIATRGLGLPRA